MGQSILINNKIKLPYEVSKIISILEENGYEAYAVGGAIRDILLGLEPKDWDITTNANPFDVKKIFRKTIDTGIEHGTVTVRMNNKSFEVTTYRVDGEYLDNRRPSKVSFTCSLKEDLIRRDFTINALAYNDKIGVVDEVNGINDLKNRVIRCVGVARKRFEEDALRILRAFRFSTRFNFEIEEETKKGIILLKDNLSNISYERILVELNHILESNYSDRFLELYEYGILNIILPKLDSSLKININIGDKCFNGAEYTRMMLKNSQNNLILRWSILLHPTYILKGRKEINDLLTILRMDKKSINRILRLLDNLGKDILNGKGNIRRLAGNLEDDFHLYSSFYKAIIESGFYDDSDKKNKELAELCENYNEILYSNDPLSLKDLKIDGKDLISLGIKGRNIGITLNLLLELVYDDPCYNNRELLIKKALDIKEV